jgi:N-methylhydantoinase A
MSTQVEPASPGLANGGVRAAVDVGGTFTDVFVLDRDGRTHVAKTPSTADPMDGVLRGVAAAGVDWKNVALFSHGTTIATNALITRKFPPAAMVTTKGFRDIIEIRRGTREDLWDTYKEIAPPYIRRRDRLTVTERIDYSGKVLDALDEDEAREVARILRKRAVQTVAVCFANAYANPANEDRMREILKEELPDVNVTTSSEILPEIFEHERFSTTVANAVLAPIIQPYASRLGSRLKERGYHGDVLLLHSGGGVMTAAMAERFAARLAASGIAAGAIASRHIARLCGFENSIGFDMGGTSTDVSLADRGELRTTTEWFVEYGYPICFPSIEVLTIGAGGGSISWIDEAGSLRNGPQSAGADPGPACYGSGSVLPTNTDANLVLGRIGSELVGGAMTLDRGAAERALLTIAEPLGLSIDEAARATIKVANANMADAVRLISIRRGYDPRDFALVAFGGAGPLHGAALARELAIPTVVVPPNPGVTSAMGCMLVDVQHDITRMYLSSANDADPGAVETAFQELEAEGRERLAHEGVPEEHMSFQRFMDMRYQGQWRSLPAAVGSPITSLDAAIEEFHKEHGREHNYRRDDAPVEIYRLSLRAIGVTPKPEMARRKLEPAAQFSPVGERSVLFDEGDARLVTPVYQRDDLPPGATFDGPAIIDQLDSTTVVPPGTRATVDEWLNIRIDILEN